MKDCLMVTDDRAPEGYLKWLSGSGEVIPAEQGLFYELAYDEDGSVNPTMVIRDAESFAIAGVQLSYAELMDFAQWAFQNALAQVKFQSSCVAGTMGRLYAREQMGKLLGFIAEQQPEVFAGLIDKAQREIIERDTRRLVQMEMKIEHMTHILALEERNAAVLVEITKIAAMPDRERDEALKHPVVQALITQAVLIVADAKRPA